MPIQFDSIANISLEAKLISLSSANLEALAPSANLTPTREVADGVANTAPVPKGTNKVFSAVRLGLKHSVVLSTFALKQRAKHHSVLKAKLP